MGKPEEKSWLIVDTGERVTKTIAQLLSAAYSDEDFEVRYEPLGEGHAMGHAEEEWSAGITDAKRYLIAAVDRAADLPDDYTWDNGNVLMLLAWALQLVESGESERVEDVWVRGFLGITHADG